MSYGVNSIQIHKKLRLDKRAGSEKRYARLTLPNGKRLIKTTKTDEMQKAGWGQILNSFKLYTEAQH